MIFNRAFGGPGRQPLHLILRHGPGEIKEFGNPDQRTFGNLPDIHHLLKHLIGGLNGAGIGLERPLVHNHVGELLGDVHV